MSVVQLSRVRLTANYMSRAVRLTREIRQYNKIKPKTVYDWDILDELYATKHRTRDRFMLTMYDPLDEYCSDDENKSDLECRIYEL